MQLAPTSCFALSPPAASTSLVVQLGAAPVAALLVPLDAVASAEADPVRHGLVLVDLLGVLLLDGKRLEAAHFLGCGRERPFSVRTGKSSCDSGEFFCVRHSKIRQTRSSNATKP